MKFKIFNPELRTKFNQNEIKKIDISIINRESEFFLKLIL